MAIKKYRFKFYMNAKHSLSPDDIHSHTWELAIDVVNMENKFVVFNEIERVIENYLSYYTNKYLNDIRPFDQLLPIVENMGDVIAFDLAHILAQKRIYLYSFAISENPTRTYVLDIDENGFENPLERGAMSNIDITELQQNAEKERVQQRLGISPNAPSDDGDKKKKWNPFSAKK